MGTDRKFTSEFIELYKTFPCLWDKSNPNYRIPAQRDIAYSFLVEKMREVDPNASKILVTSKINTLRCNYRKEHLRVLEKKRNGHENFNSSLWYYDIMSFLDDQQAPYKRIKVPTSEEDNSMNNELSEEKVPKVESQAKKRKIVLNDSDQMTNHVVLARLQPIHNIDTTEYITFGNHVAEELRKIPPEMIPYVKKIINDAIFEGHMLSLNRFSRIISVIQE